MKYPSLEALIQSFKKAIFRFPLEILFALTGTLSATISIEIVDINHNAESYLIRLILVSVLGLSLSLSATLFSESRAIKKTLKYVLRLVVIALCTSLFFLLDPLKQESDILKFLLLALSSHLLVSFSAYTRSGFIHAFWVFNKTIFLRFLTGGLYSAGLFLGLSAAIGSMNFLFNFNFEWDTFVILWIWTVGMFQTIFFLSGVPENLFILEEDKSYPIGLKVFTQYVLIPLATVYSLILLAYEAKILIEWELPKGLVANLILGYAVFGILSLLLIYPVRNLDENKWLKKFSQSFYYVLIPLIALLIWAILARIIDYGITEERYFLMVLSGWLIFITAYFLISKSHNITIIPLSLCILTVLSVYGPQGAFQTSKRSQLSELIHLFEKYDSADDGKIKALTRIPVKEDMLRMVNIVDYLVDNHGLKSFNLVLDQNLNVVEDSLHALNRSENKNIRINTWGLRSNQKDWLYKQLKLNSYDLVGAKLDLGTNMFEAENIELKPLSKADFMIQVSQYPDSAKSMINNSRLLISQVQNQNRFKVEYGSEVNYFYLDTLINKLDSEFKKQEPLANGQTVSVSRKLLSQNLELEGIAIEILWNNLNYNDQKKLISANGDALIKIK